MAFSGATCMILTSSFLSNVTGNVYVARSAVPHLVILSKRHAVAWQKLCSDFFFPFQQAIKLRLQVCGDCSDWKPLGGESSAVIRGAETWVQAEEPELQAVSFQNSKQITTLWALKTDISSFLLKAPVYGHFFVACFSLSFRTAPLLPAFKFWVVCADLFSFSYTVSWW